MPDQAASLILRSFVSRSGLRQTRPTGDQLRIWRDHRALMDPLIFDSRPTIAEVAVTMDHRI